MNNSLENMTVHIKRHELYSDVTIFDDDTGVRLSTSLDRGVKENDKSILKLKRQIRHIQKPSEKK